MNFIKFNKINKKYLIVVFIILVISLAMVCFAYNRYPAENTFSNLPVEGISEELINTEKEAVDFAKQDADIASFANKYKDLSIDYLAYYNQELGVWQVQAYAKDKRVNDLDYQISFYPNGKITFKGSIPL
jgi:hypothetical protein